MPDFAASRNALMRRLITSRDLLWGMEVGVRDGEFARHLLSTTNVKLFGVDRAVTTTARALEDEFPGRYKVYEGVSPDCASVYTDRYFDFVYLDADHRYEAVVADLEAWWPKVVPGGLFCGDDYADVDNPEEGVYGVVRAVNAFADRYGLTLRVDGAASDNRVDQLACAAFNGLQATRYLRRQPYLPFQNPMWYLFKEPAHD